MNRRDLFAGLFAGGAFTLGNAYLWQWAEQLPHPEQTAADIFVDDPVSDSEFAIEADEARQHLAEKQKVAAVEIKPPQIITSPAVSSSVTSDKKSETKQQPKPVEKPVVIAQSPSVDQSRVIEKVRNFENEFADDIHLSKEDVPVMHSVLLRLQRIERLVGHGNYNLISFDDSLKYARRYPKVGAFTPKELQFIESVFFAEAKRYGFFGDKVTQQLTDKISKRDTFKVPYSGHWLFKGDSMSYYEKLKKDIGPNIILTSGIRSNVKQLHLFLAKCVKSNNNLSKASRSLAPPGHSYHGIGDFDVGRVGWGIKNFTQKFASTDEFKKMLELGYVQIRYTEDNRLGVRFEPWHIMVV